MRGQRKNPRKAVQPFENKKRKIDIFKNYEANGVEKIQRKLEIFSTLISKKSTWSPWERTYNVINCETDKADVIDTTLFGFENKIIHHKTYESRLVSDRSRDNKWGFLQHSLQTKIASKTLREPSRSLFFVFLD